MAIPRAENPRAATLPRTAPLARPKERSGNVRRTRKMKRGKQRPLGLLRIDHLDEILDGNIGRDAFIYKVFRDIYFFGNNASPEPWIP